MQRLGILVVLAAVLAGCSTSGPAVTEKDGRIEVTLYREERETPDPKVPYYQFWAALEVRL